MRFNPEISRMAVYRIADLPITRCVPVGCKRLLHYKLCKYLYQGNRGVHRHVRRSTFSPPFSGLAQSLGFARIWFGEFPGRAGTRNLGALPGESVIDGRGHLVLIKTATKESSCLRSDLSRCFYALLESSTSAPTWLPSILSLRGLAS